jgi:hypothetical protein
MFDMTSHTLDQAPALSDRQMAHMDAVTEQLQRLNMAIRDAVDSGLSIELHRSERYHCGGGCWGDMMKPVIVKCM